MNRSRSRGDETPELDLDRIRNALDESTQVHGLRVTAKQLSMSPSGLRNLLDGAAPYGKTIRRIQAWYAQWSQHHGSPDIANRVAIGVLVATIPAERRQAAVEYLEGVIGTLRRG